MFHGGSKEGAKKSSPARSAPRIPETGRAAPARPSVIPAQLKPGENFQLANPAFRVWMPQAAGSDTAPVSSGRASSTDRTLDAARARAARHVPTEGHGLAARLWHGFLQAVGLEAAPIAPAAARVVTTNNGVAAATAARVVAPVTVAGHRPSAPPSTVAVAKNPHFSADKATGIAGSDEFEAKASASVAAGTDPELSLTGSVAPNPLYVGSDPAPLMSSIVTPSLPASTGAGGTGIPLPPSAPVAEIVAPKLELSIYALAALHNGIHRNAMRKKIERDRATATAAIAAEVAVVEEANAIESDTLNFVYTMIYEVIQGKKPRDLTVEAKNHLTGLAYSELLGYDRALKGAAAGVGSADIDDEAIRVEALRRVKEVLSVDRAQVAHDLLIAQKPAATDRDVATVEERARRDVETGIIASAQMRITQALLTPATPKAAGVYMTEAERALAQGAADRGRNQIYQGRLVRPKAKVTEFITTHLHAGARVIYSNVPEVLEAFIAANQAYVDSTPSLATREEILAYVAQIEKVSVCAMSLLQEARLLHQKGVAPELIPTLQNYAIRLLSIVESVRPRLIDSTDADNPAVLADVLAKISPSGRQNDVDAVRVRLLAYDLNIAQQALAEGPGFMTRGKAGAVVPATLAIGNDFIAVRSYGLNTEQALTRARNHQESVRPAAPAPVPAPALEELVAVAEGADASAAVVVSPPGSEPPAVALPGRLPVSDAVTSEAGRDPSALLAAQAPDHKAQALPLPPAEPSTLTLLSVPKAEVKPVPEIKLNPIPADVARTWLGLGPENAPAAQIVADCKALTRWWGGDHGYANTIRKYAAKDRAGVLVNLWALNGNSIRENFAFLERDMRRIAQNISHLATAGDLSATQLKEIEPILKIVEEAMTKPKFTNLGKDESFVKQCREHILLEVEIARDGIALIREKRREAFAKSKLAAAGLIGKMVSPTKGVAVANPLQNSPTSEDSIAAENANKILAYKKQAAKLLYFTGPCSDKTLVQVLACFGQKSELKKLRDIKEQVDLEIKAMEIEGTVPVAEDKDAISDEYTAAAAELGVNGEMFSMDQRIAQRERLNAYRETLIHTKILVWLSDPVKYKDDIHTELQRLGFGSVKGIENRISRNVRAPGEAESDTVVMRNTGKKAISRARCKDGLKAAEVVAIMALVAFGAACAYGRYENGGDNNVATWFSENTVLAPLCGCKPAANVIPPPSPSPSVPPSPFPTVGPTVVATPSYTVIPTLSPVTTSSPVGSVTPIPTPSSLLPASATSSGSGSGSASVTGSNSPSTGASASSTSSNSATDSRTSSATASASPSASSTTSVTNSGSITSTATSSHSATDTATSTMSSSHTGSNSPSSSASNSSTMSASTSASVTPPHTPSPSASCEPGSDLGSVSAPTINIEKVSPTATNLRTVTLTGATAVGKIGNVIHLVGPGSFTTTGNQDITVEGGSLGHEVGFRVVDSLNGCDVATYGFLYEDTRRLLEQSDVPAEATTFSGHLRGTAVKTADARPESAGGEPGVRI